MPVFFISAYREEQVVAKVLDKGAVDYIVNPFSQAEHTTRIRAALRLFQSSAVTWRRGLCGLCLTGNSNGLVDH